MTPTGERLQFLLDRYANNIASEQEIIELLDLMKDDTAEQLLEEQIHQSAAGPQVNHAVDWKRMWTQISPARRSTVRPGWWIAAAVLLLAATLPTIFIFRKQSANQSVGMQTISQDKPAPQSNKATIQLADGRKVPFEEMAVGRLDIDSNITVIKGKDGTIEYKNVDPKSQQGFNTISVQRGSRPLRIRLLDGSNVWLNVASSITFPVPFSENTRGVLVSGEVYFDVAHNPRSPFIVTAGKMSLQVIGTEFNVKAYADEDSTLATLVQGKVNIKNDSGAVLTLSPNQQARMNRIGQLTFVRDGDVASAVAWRKDIFIFDNSPIEYIMRQVSRWYDVEIVYEGKLTGQNYAGSISRKESLTKLLKTLEYTGTVQFRMEGNKVIVSEKLLEQ